ncbi:hypothetical protein RN001_001807 [Aquatica leii]|uniref:MSP domain-containing protein n=1 Tax=Aquatica leii TaxID=1421715 RepID=A0AAN7PLM0_9COLE|nr:hypothetical protein RN001_001807 [Aquatica leii]
MEKGKSDYTDETVLTTPKPRASSTVNRHQPLKKYNVINIPLSFSPDSHMTSSSSINSLGILNIDDVNTNSLLDQGNAIPTQRAIDKLREQRAFANNILEKSKGLGLPSRYLQAESFRNSMCTISSESTVNETDLLVKEKIFNPDEISTPRSSCVSALLSKPGKSFYRPSSITSKSIAELSEKIRNSDMSLADLCNQYCNLSFKEDGRLRSYNEESFVSGELADEKLAEGERSWRREINVLGDKSLRSDSIFSVRDPSMSISEFFRKKSELDELCFKKSPEKKTAVPLIEKSVAFQTIDESNVKLETSESVLNASDIEKALLVDDNTAKIVELIGKTKSKKSSSNTKENFKQPKTNSIQHLAKAKTHKPSEPLRDSRNVTRDTAYLDSTTSIHTASSLDSLPGGKLPIETNRIELIWGCVRTGKRKIQNFTLRNKSQNKLRLQISSSNTCFRILSDHSDLESVSVLSILMYPAESRSFTVAFIPTSVGAVVGKLNFTPVGSELQMQQKKRQMLMMFGYGGHANIEVQNVLKDTNMKMWLSLGKLDNMPQLTQTFELQNIGNISAFAFLKFNSKALYESSRVSIYPTELVLHSKEKTSIRLTYTPTKEDAKHLFAIATNQVMEIGTIQIITGAEAVRGRIRLLCRKLKQESGIVENQLIEQLSKKFPNEKMPTDLKHFTETVGSVKELLQNFDSKEITITLEKDTEHTLVGQIGGIDESSMFQSLCEGMTTFAAGKTHFTTCIVEPTNIILTPPTKTTDAVVLINNSNSTMQFEAVIEPSEGLKVSPAEGLILASETVLIHISCNTKKLKQQTYFKLSVYINDDVFEVDIKVIFLRSFK